jgi:hypothetical protein
VGLPLWVYLLFCILVPVSLHISLERIIEKGCGIKSDQATAQNIFDLIRRSVAVQTDIDLEDPSQLTTLEADSFSSLLSKLLDDPPESPLD